MVLLFLLQKELRQIFRDSSVYRIFLLEPMLQLLLLPLAADYQIKTLHLGVVDHDKSQYSQRLINEVISSGYFKLTEYTANYTDALHSMENDKVAVILEIPANFERDLIKNSEADLLVAINAINGIKGGLGSSYIQQIIQNYNQSVRMKLIDFPRFNPQPTIEVVHSNWYNPNMNYQRFMVPGILVMLLTMIGFNYSALNIVKEKELGTIEQINVSPIKKTSFILGKLIPFWVMGLVVLTVGFIIARFVYGIVPVGSYSTLYIFAAIYLVALLGLGLLLSTYSQTQQQAFLVAFFILMIFILLSGLFTPIGSMPRWAQVITWFNPVAYFMEVIRMVIMKGSGLADIKNQLFAMGGFAVFFNGWAILNYRKRS